MEGSKNYCCMNEFRPKKIVVKENYISAAQSNTKNFYLPIRHSVGKKNPMG